MLVVLNRKCLEATLIQMAGARRVIMGMPTHGVRVCQPAEKIGQLMVGLRSQYEMPMIGHHAIREDADWDALVGFLENTLEGFIVGVFLEQRQPRHRPIQGMVHVPSRRISRTARHRLKLPKATTASRFELRPLCSARRLHSRRLSGTTATAPPPYSRHGTRTQPAHIEDREASP